MTIELAAYLENEKREDYIPLTECKKGFLYKLHSRNLDLGVFNGKTGFIGIRQKFGHNFLFTEFHYDTGAPYGTVKPLEELEALPADISPTELEYHEFGSADWRDDPITNKSRPVLRRVLKEGEAQHGKREGFVDEWADTGERLPDGLFPYCKQNTKLFEWLKTKYDRPII